MRQVLAARRMFSWLPTDEFSKAYQLGNMLGEGAYGMVFKATPALPASVSEEEDGADDGSAAAPLEYAVKRIKREGLSEQEEQEVIAEVGGGGRIGDGGGGCRRLVACVNIPMCLTVDQALIPTLKIGTFFAWGGKKNTRCHRRYTTPAEKQRTGLDKTVRGEVESARVVRWSSSNN